MQQKRSRVLSIVLVSIVLSSGIAYAATITAPEIPRFGDNGDGNEIDDTERASWQIIFNFTTGVPLTVGDTLYLLNGTDALAANLTSSISHVVTQAEINQNSLNFTTSDLNGLSDGNYIFRGQWVDTVGDGDAGTQGDEAATLTLDSDDTPTATLTPTPTSPSSSKTSLSFAIQFSEPMGEFIAADDIDIDFNGAGFANAAGTLTSSGTDSYTYTLSAGELASIGTGTPSETVTLRLLASVEDTGGNGLTQVDSVWTFDASLAPSSGSGGSDQQWKTKPTFGLDHNTFRPLVDGGFSFNGKSHDIIDNWWTPFAEQKVKIGSINSFTAKAYADKQLRIQEFLFGIPAVGEAHNAELGIEVVYDYSGEIDRINVIQKTDIIDIDSIKVKHSKSKCQSDDTVERCDTTRLSMKFLEPLQDKIMAIKAIDFKNRVHITYLNEGFDISGNSLNPMNTMMIIGTEKHEGLVEVTQIAKYSDIWTTQDGREFERNESGSFAQINQSFERHIDTGVIKNRMHSEFNTLKQSQVDLASIIMSAYYRTSINYEDPFSEINDIFAYEYPVPFKSKLDNPEIQNNMILQAEKAQKVMKQLLAPILYYK